MSDFFQVNTDAQQDYILVRTLGRGAFGEANLYRKIEVNNGNDSPMNERKFKMIFSIMRESLSREKMPLPNVYEFFK